MNSVQKVFATLEYIKNKLNAYSFTVDELFPVGVETQEIKDLIEYCEQIQAFANNIKIELKEFMEIWKNTKEITD